MKMHMIAVVYQNNIQVGYRIFDSDSGKIMDASNESIMSAIKANNKIFNLEIKDGKLSGSNGATSRFAKIANGKLEGKAPIIIIKQVGSVGFIVSDYKGTTMKLKEADTIALANKFGIANGMVKDNNGTVFISSISGKYDYEEYVEATVKTKPSETKPIETQQVEPKQAEPKQAEPKQAEPKQVEPKQAEPKQAEPKQAEQEIKIYFNEDQLSALKKYYTWAMLDEDTADKEISILNDKVAKKSGITSSIFLDIVYMLGSVYRITKAFGNELGTHIASFMMVGLDFPESMLITASGTARLDTQAFFKQVFPNFEEAISNIYSNLDSMFFVAAKNILEYVLDYEILGEYKPFLDKDVSDKIEASKKYALIKNVDMASLRLLIGVIDIAKEFTAELESAINNRWSNNNSTLYAYTLLYYLNSLEFCSPYSRETDGIKCYNHEKLNTTNRKYRKTRLRRAIYEVVGLYKRYYTQESVETIFKHEVDKTIETGKEVFSDCVFIGTPIDYRFSGLSEERSIYHMYDLVKLLVSIDDTIISDFKEFRAAVQKSIDAESLANIQRKQMERYNNTDISTKSNRDSAVNKGSNIPEDRNIADKSTESAIEQTSSTVQNIVINPKDDRVETYIKLSSVSKKDYSNDTSFIIAKDMISRRLKYKDMSAKQKYRLNDAIKKLCEELGIQDTMEVKPVNASTDPDVNNTYFIDDHPDIKDKVRKLIDKSDSVEMSAVLEKEPSVLSICYSILKRGKASDRQLRHIESAIKILENQ